MPGTIGRATNKMERQSANVNRCQMASALRKEGNWAGETGVGGVVISPITVGKECLPTADSEWSPHFGVRPVIMGGPGGHTRSCALK